VERPAAEGLSHKSVGTGAGSQSTNQAIDAGIGHGFTDRLTPQVHKHIVAVQCPVLVVQVVAVESDETGVDGHFTRPGLGSSAVGIESLADGDLTAPGIDVLVAKTEGLADAEASACEQTQKEAVTESSTTFNQALDVRRPKLTRSTAFAAQPDGLMSLGPRSQVGKERLPRSAPATRPPSRQQPGNVHAVASVELVERGQR
jgi:hypothetical protein